MSERGFGARECLRSFWVYVGRRYASLSSARGAMRVDERGLYVFY